MIKELFNKLKTNYIKGINNVFDYKTRATRSEYWYFHFANSIIIGAFSLLQLPSISFTVALVSIIPAFSLLIRRLHDTNHSGIHAILYLIPFVGPFILLYLMLLKSDLKPNKYGHPDSLLLKKHLKHEFDKDGKPVFNFQFLPNYREQKNDNVNFIEKEIK